MVETVPREEWDARLRGFTDRHAGRPVDLDVGARGAEPRRQERGHRLYGVVLDPRDGGIQIMLGEFGPDAEGGAGPHLTHTVRKPRYLDVVTDAEGRETALRVTGEDGQAVLRLRHGETDGTARPTG